MQTKTTTKGQQSKQERWNTSPCKIGPSWAISALLQTVAVLFYVWQSCAKEPTFLSLSEGRESKSKLESCKAGAGAHFPSLMTDAEFCTAVRIFTWPIWPNDPCKDGIIHCVHLLIDAQVLLPPQVLQDALHHGIWRLRRKWKDGLIEMVSIGDKEHDTTLHNVWLKNMGFEWQVPGIFAWPCSGAVWTLRPLAGRAGMWMQGENAPSPFEYVY